MTTITRTPAESATLAAENLRRAAENFRMGDTDYAHKRSWGSMDILAGAGESRFGQRIAALGYMHDFPGEYPALVAERIASEIDALVAGGHVGNRR